MPLDEAALITALETDTAYDADVVAGNNGALVALLNAEDGALPKRWKAIPVDDFRDAIAPEYAGLTAAKRQQIDNYTQNGGSVAVHKPAIRAWLQANFTGPVLIALRDLAQIEGTPAHAFIGLDDTKISLADVRRLVRGIAKSAVHPANKAIAEARREARRREGDVLRQQVQNSWDGNVRAEFKGAWDAFFPNTAAGNMEKLRREERREKLERYRELRRVTPMATP